MKIFLAGATGVIGRRLTPLLVAAGHDVTGTTRSADKAAALKEQGAQAVVVDVFDRTALRDAVVQARPDVVIHRLTDLPQAFDPERRGEALRRNARLRIEGTANLVAAARAGGARRLISQSIAFIYADGPEPHAEDDPLAAADGDDLHALTTRGVRTLEGATLNTPVSTASYCATGGFMVQERGLKPRRAGDRYTLTPRHRRPCLPSPAAGRASTTSPRMMAP